MTTATLPEIKAASVYEFATYEASPLSEFPLRSWKEAAADEYRQVDRVHDCFSVIRKLDAPDLIAPETLAQMLHEVQGLADRPVDLLLGRTVVMVVQLNDEEATDETLVALLGEPSDRLAGGRLGDGVDVYSSAEQDVLVFTCGPGRAAASAALRIVYGAVRLVETLRHKIQAQYAEYTQEYRDPLLRAEQRLNESVARLGGLVESNEDCDATLTASQQVANAYCETELLRGPVKKIEAMLAANLRNLAEVRDRHYPTPATDPGVNLLRQRVASIDMHLAQVRADLGLVEPVLRAARSVGQFHHSQLLAALTSTEAKENRQREVESRKREASNCRFMLLGLWIGISQLWLGWVALTPSESRPSGWSLLTQILAPTLLGVLFYIGTMIRYRFSTPNRNFAKRYQKTHGNRKRQRGSLSQGFPR